jgi:hypothetical protein
MGGISGRSCCYSAKVQGRPGRFWAVPAATADFTLGNSLDGYYKGKGVYMLRHYRWQICWHSSLGIGPGRGRGGGKRGVLRLCLAVLDFTEISQHHLRMSMRRICKVWVGVCMLLMTDRPAVATHYGTCNQGLACWVLLQSHTVHRLLVGRGRGPCC